MYSVSQKKSPLKFSDIFSQTVGNFLVQILHTYYVFPSMLVLQILSNYLQFWWNYAILSVTTQFTPCSQCSPLAETHADIFWHFSRTAENYFLIQILHTY